MKAEYAKLITELDKTLSLIRKQWVDTKPSKEKDGYYQRINEALDERFRLMKLRDSEK